MSNRRIRIILLALFFLSGTSALIYQIVWVRMFGLVFGVTVFAVSTVLTTFMAGLALGSLWFGRRVDKGGDPLRLFAFLQLGIGLFGLAFPWLLQGLTCVYVHIHQQVGTGFYLRSLIRFALSFLLLLIPTTLMGGTLPVLSKFFVKKLKNLGWDIGHLYSVNNLGAVIGVLLAGFLLIETAGIRATIFIAAAVNLFIALVVLAMRRPLTAQPEALDSQIQNGTEVIVQQDLSEESGAAYPPYVLRLVLWAFAVEGFTTLAYEVIWTRILLGVSDHKSVYFFSTIVISFIFGLSLGSFIVARFIDLKKNLLALFGFVEIAIGVSAVALLPVFAFLPHVLTRIHASYGGAWWSSVGLESLIFFVVMLIPTTLMGTTFPIVGKIYTLSLNRLGSRIGDIGCLDTVGSIFGAFVAGFVLIPFVGVVNAVVLTALINLVIGAVLIFFHPAMRSRAKLATAVVLACIVGIACLVAPSGIQFKHWEDKLPTDKLLYYKEGTSATVAVPASADGTKRLAINGAITAHASYDDLRVHRMLAYLPMLLQENPKNALVIGLGMGVTAQSLIHPAMDEVDCVELCPEVVDAAAQCFREENDDVLENPKLNLIIEDGRSYLAITNKKYDIITSNAVHVRLSGNLYTRDFYEICRKRLTKDGVMCQWLPTNWLSETEYQMLIKAFMDAFPHTSLWYVNIYHTILIGTPRKLQIDFNSFKGKLEDKKVKSDLTYVELDDPFPFLAQYVGDEHKLASYVRDAPANTDNHPCAEFSRAVDKGPARATLESLSKLRDDIGEIVVNVGETPEEAGQVKEKLARFSQSRAHAARASLYRHYSKDLETDVEAFREVHQASAINPEDRRTARALSKAKDYFIATVRQHLSDRDANQAVRLCKELLEIDPQWPDLLVELGLAYNEMGKHDESTRAIKQAIKLAPDSASAYGALGFVYLRSEMYERATINFQEAAKWDPKAAAPHFYLGVIYAGSGMLDKATAEFKRAMELSPNSVETRYHLAMAYARKGKFEEARSQLKESLRINPKHQPSLSALEDLERRGQKRPANAH